jgi:hypothetical protein
MIKNNQPCATTISCPPCPEGPLRSRSSPTHDIAMHGAAIAGGGFIPIGLDRVKILQTSEPQLAADTNVSWLLAEWLQRFRHCKERPKGTNPDVTRDSEHAVIVSIYRSTHTRLQMLTYQSYDVVGLFCASSIRSRPPGEKLIYDTRSPRPTTSMTTF